MTFRNTLLVGLASVAALLAARTVEAQSASIDAARAEFRFAADPKRVYQWNTPDSIAYVGRPEFIWRIFWNPPEGRSGHDPDMLWIVVRWSPGGVRRGGLEELLRDARVEVGTFCLSCGTPAATSVTDTSVRFEVRNDAVVFVVDGATAVSRIFPTRPDSVVFTRDSLGVTLGEVKTVVKRQ